MSYLLRKVNRKKWEPNLGVAPTDYTADAITGCTKTTQNTLSVWHSDENIFDSKDCKLLIVALASNMDRPDTIDLVWLLEDKLQSRGLVIEQSDGMSKCITANENHRDLVGLKHKDLALVGHHIVEQLLQPEFVKRITRPKLIELMIQAVCDNQIINYYELSENWQKVLFKKMDDKQKLGFAA
jgi:hypothetical protein